MYCTLEAVFDRAPALRDDVEAVGRAQSGIVYAQSRIDARLDERFIVPFTAPVPELVREIATDIAAGKALASSFSGSQSTEHAMYAQQLLDSGLKMLDEVATGVLLIADATTKVTIPNRRSPLYVTALREEPIETMDLLGRFGPRRP